VAGEVGLAQRDRVRAGPGLDKEPSPGAASRLRPLPQAGEAKLIYATVLEGAVKIQVNQGPVRTFKAGENFTELPGDHHGVSANASETEPSKLLAVFVVNTDETELVTPDPK